MHSLEQILSKTDNGQKILDVALKLAFQNVRIYRSSAEHTLCLVLDFDSTPTRGSAAYTTEQSDAIAENALILQLTTAKFLDCNVIVLQNDLMSKENRVHINQYSILLPIEPTPLSRLVSIFGKPADFHIKTIKNDQRYESNFEIFEATLKDEQRYKDAITTFEATLAPKEAKSEHRRMSF